MYGVVGSAPDEAAVRQRHASHGVVCRRVRRVQSLGATTHALSPEEKAIVRQMIAAEVHPFGQPDVASGGFPSAELGGGWVRQVG